MDGQLDGLREGEWEVGRTGVSSFSGECHQCVLVQCSRLVVGGLENRCTSHGSFRGRNDGEVLSSDSE